MSLLLSFFSSLNSIFYLFFVLSIPMLVVVSFIRDRDRGGEGCDFSVTAALEEEE